MHLPARQFNPWLLASLLTLLTAPAFGAGELDCSFDGDGRKVQSFTGGLEQADDLEILADGSIVTLGGDGDSTPSGILRFSRFLPTGALDTTFGGGTGTVLNTIPGVTFGDFAFVSSVLRFTRDSAGRYLVVGSAILGTDREVFVGRFTTAGALDTTFGGGDGWTSFDWTGVTDGSAVANDAATEIVVDASDRPIVGGWVDPNGPTFNPSNREFAFARLTTAGALDGTFGTGGITIVSSPGTTTDDTLRDMKLDPSGRVVGVGDADPNLTNARDAMVVRLTTAGLPDATFDGDGLLILDLTQTGSTASVGDDVAQVVAFTPDSPARIVIAGFAPQTLAIARLLDGGGLDLTLGVDGIVNYDFEVGSQNVLEHAFVQPDGKILITGWVPFDFSVMRLEVDGDLDPTWAGDGRQTVNILNNDRAYAAGLMADGRVALAGGTGNDTDMALARFLGDSGVVSGSSTTIVSDLPDPSVTGQAFNVAISVQATGGSTAPTGTVSVGDGVQSTSCALVPPGSGTTSTASCALALTTLGARNLTATYPGNGSSVCGSSSTPATPHQVIANSSTTTISSDLPDPSVVGQSVAISYTVVAAAGTPTGNVTVSDGTSSCVGSVAAGSCSISFPTAGPRNLVATYPGDGTVPASASTAEPHLVNPAATATTISSDAPDPSVVGESITVQYGVAVTGPGSGTPTGNVTVSDGVDSCTASVAAGQCDLALTTLGNRNLVATYAGDTNFAASASGAAAHQVNQAATVTTISSDAPDPSVVGQSITVQYGVAVTGPGSGTPTGNVTVSDGVDSCIATVAAGQCSLALTTAGARNLIATYAGDTNFSSSDSAPAPHTVNQGSTTLIITADNPDPSAVNIPILVAWALTPVPPAVGVPTGNVTVTVSGGSETCSAPALTGDCALTLTGLGSRTITATYSGDGSFEASVDTEAHEVVSGSSTTTISADTPDPSVVGQSIQVDFTVASSSGTPTGTVTIGDGIGGSCTGPLVAGSGSCSFAPAQAGALTLTATYSGDGQTAASQGTAPHLVDPAATTLLLQGIAPEPSAPGQAAAIAFALTVNAPGSGTPTGTVTIDSAGQSCTAPVADGVCSIVWPTSGQFDVTASYSGDANFTASQTATPISHGVAGVVEIPTLDTLGLIGLAAGLAFAARKRLMRRAR